MHSGCKAECAVPLASCLPRQLCTRAVPIPARRVSGASAVPLTHVPVCMCPAVAVLERHRGHADEEGDGAVAALCHIHTQRNKPPCLDTTPLSAAALLDHLRAGANYERQIVHVERLPARAARYGVLPFELHPPVCSALADVGITPPQLFCHQVEAIVALLQQRHVAVCTSTASGKSLCYVVPILQVRVRAAHGRHACCGATSTRAPAA